MPDRIYVTPLIVIQDGGPDGDSPERVPKYYDEVMHQNFGVLDYGTELTAIIGYKDFSATDHTTMSGKSDVLAVPANLDNNLTAGAVTQTETYLETIHIPGDWVTTAYTYRDVLRIVGGIFQFNQRYFGRYEGNIIEKASNNLELEWRDIPSGIRAEIQDVADSFPLDKGGVTATTKVRRILFLMGQQFNDMPIQLGGIEI